MLIEAGWCWLMLNNSYGCWWWLMLIDADADWCQLMLIKADWCWCWLTLVVIFDFQWVTWWAWSRLSWIAITGISRGSIVAVSKSELLAIGARGVALWPNTPLCPNTSNCKQKVKSENVQCMPNLFKKLIKAFKKPPGLVDSDKHGAVSVGSPSQAEAGSLGHPRTLTFNSSPHELVHWDHPPHSCHSVGMAAILKNKKEKHQEELTIVLSKGCGCTPTCAVADI